MPILEKTLRAIVLLGVFALPFVCLIVASSLFFPFITGKNFAFRIIVEIIAGVWLSLALVSPKYRPRRSWLLAAFALFVLIIAIADAQGAVPFKSFWSNYERMDGWVTLAHLLAYLVVILSVLNTEKLWKWLFHISLGVSVLLAIYGCFQVAGDLAISQGSGSGLSARIDATFGNPIYLAVYMLFHIFIAALLCVQAWRSRDLRLLAIFYGVAIALDTVALFFTGTRGTMLGLVGGAVLAVLLYALLGKSWRFRILAVGSVVLVVACGAWLHAAKDAPFVKGVGFLDRLASISLSDSTIKARFLNMGIAWQGVKERPILGWGQENYAVVFDKYYDPRMYGQEPWFDRVHNIVFDWWIAGGTLGLLSYLSIFVLLLWAIWRGSLKGSEVFTLAERSILTGLLAGYFFHNLTVFDNVTSYILFVTLIGYIAWRQGEATSSKRLTEATPVPATMLPFVAVAAALVIWGVAWYVNAGALAKNRALIQAIQPQSEGVLGNLRYFKEAIAERGYGNQEVREQLAQISTQIGSSQNVDMPSKQQFFDAATSEMQKQQAESPEDARFPLFLGILLSSFGDYKDAAVALQQAHELSPRKQSILFTIAQVQDAQGDSKGALQTLKQAYELDTENTDAFSLYAGVAISTGQDALADELLAPRIASGAAANPRIAAAYAARGRFDKIAVIWEGYVRASPQDPQGYFTLAAAYYQGGQKERAITTLQEAASAIPSVKDQVDLLIQEVRNGTAQLGKTTQ